MAATATGGKRCAEPGRLRLGPGAPGRFADRHAAAVRPIAPHHPGACGGESVTTNVNKLGDALFTAEGGGWLTLRRRAPGLRELSAAELLQRTAQAPGNVRYAIDDEGPYLIEELRT